MTVTTIHDLRSRLVPYLGLAKPRIIELLLVTTVPAMVAAAGGWPSTRTVVATLIGGTLSAAGANTLNNLLDRELDAEMRRTRRRSLPLGRVTPGGALLLGVGLGLAGLVWLWVTTNLLAALLATGALLFYVLVYTRWLKPITSQNIVIGGAAGAVPPLVGWAAVTGELHAAAWVMFGVVFAWTPAHFWALSLRFRDDYARAGIPMLPAVVGEAEATRFILLYALLSLATSLLLFPAAPMGYLYLVGAVILGSWLVVKAAELRRHPQRAMGFFNFSNFYLAALFGVIALDRLLA